MEWRLTHPPVATLHGITFTVSADQHAVKCLLAPEALSFLQHHLAPGVQASPVGLFKRFFDDIMVIAAWKHAQNAFEADGSLRLMVDDAKRALHIEP